MTKRTKYFIDKLNKAQLSEMQEFGNEFYKYAQKLIEQTKELEYKEFDYHFRKRLEYLKSFNQ